MSFKQFLMPLCAAGLLSLTAAAQTLVEHAVTAAGGSAAGVAGKKVSEGLDKIFGKLGASMEKASKQSDQNVVAPAKMPSAPDLGPEGPSSARRPAPVRRRAAVASAPRREAFSLDPRAAAVPADSPDASAAAAVNSLTATPAEFAKVAAGTPREELVARLGLPASRVLIPEEGRLLEVLRYSNPEGYLGAVQLADGKVIAVQPNPLLMK